MFSQQSLCTAYRRTFILYNLGHLKLLIVTQPLRRLARSLMQIRCKFNARTLHSLVGYQLICYDWLESGPITQLFLVLEKNVAIMNAQTVWEINYSVKWILNHFETLSILDKMGLLLYVQKSVKSTLEKKKKTSNHYIFVNFGQDPQ